MHAQERVLIGAWSNVDHAHSPVVVLVVIRACSSLCLSVHQPASPSRGPDASSNTAGRPSLIRPPLKRVRRTINRRFILPASVKSNLILPSASIHPPHTFIIGTYLYL